jgi:choline-sulfatase
MSETKDKLNVLLIMADQMTPYALSAYGNKAALTPNIDSLAKNGVLFENMYCNSPLCTPSRMSMLTGKYVNKIECWDNGGNPLGSEIPTIAHYFANSGYSTTLSGKMHMIGPDQLHGFENRLTTDIYNTGMEWTRDWDETHYHGGRNSNTGPVNWCWQMEYDERAHQRTLEWIRSVPNVDKRPFFLCASFTNPHPPYLCPQEYWDRYQDAEIDIPTWPENPIENEHIAVKWIRDYHQLNDLPTDEEVLRARRAYLGQISYIDDKVGEIVSWLDKLGYLENTIIIFTSDHGEMLGEHGCWCKRVAYDWSTKVPFIISHPDSLPKDKRIKNVCQLVDLLPTLNDLAGLGPAFNIDGNSTVPLMNNNSTNWPEEALCENYTEGMKAASCMLRKDNLKYVGVAGYEPALYDLEKDPNEFNNLAGNPDYAEKEKAMANRLAELWDAEKINKKVRNSQKEREFLTQALNKGNYKRWDYLPSLTVGKPHDLAK